MFELSVIRRYLWPTKRHLSLSLIALMSTLVISLVVWLLILFLSITEGIETNWLERLTSLNAPLRIVPTEEYYSSYYYQIDAFASESGYTYKSIRDKLLAKDSDPYQPSVDETLPIYFPEKPKNNAPSISDPVKELFSSLENLKERKTGLHFQEYETAGALLKLGLMRPSSGGFQQNIDQSFLTQVSYITSFPEGSPAFRRLITPPRAKDLNNLLFLLKFAPSKELEDMPMQKGQASDLLAMEKVKAICSNLLLHEVTLLGQKWEVPESLFTTKIKAYARLRGKELLYLLVPANAKKTSSFDTEMIEGHIHQKDGNLVFETMQNSYLVSSSRAPIVLAEDLSAKAHFISSSIDTANQLQEIKLQLEFVLQGKCYNFTAPMKNIEITKATPLTTFLTKPAHTPPWAYFIQEKSLLPTGGVLLPKNMQENRVCLGDRGYLSYTTPTNTMLQEQRIPITVAGFYDPGVMAVGARCIIADYDLVHAIASATQNLTIDDVMASGVEVWFPNLKETRPIKEDLKRSLQEKGLSNYWKTIPFYEYEFAKDLMVQFQSDKYLFMLVGIIILMVACCNIISLLLLLVNDKKYEIGIMLSLGAKKRSLAAIFGSLGAGIGFLSALIGTIFAYITLKNLDSLVHLLNLLEGQQAFNAAFYGESLPNTLSQKSILFILIVTPILSLFAGLVPAAKACKMRPSAILRSE